MIRPQILLSIEKIYKLYWILPYKQPKAIIIYLKPPANVAQDLASYSQGSGQWPCCNYRGSSIAGTCVAPETFLNHYWGPTDTVTVSDPLKGRHSASSKWSIQITKHSNKPLSQWVNEIHLKDTSSFHDISWILFEMKGLASCYHVAT